MTLQEFVSKYSGVANTGDTPENRGECVGLIEVWIDELHLTHDWGNAKDLLRGADPNSFTIIYNDSLDTAQYPPPGAIMVWGSSWGNGDGHTGVIVDATGVSFHCFEQNNPEGHAPQIVNHSNYGGVLGWLIPKIPIPTTSIPTPAPTPTTTFTQDDFITAIYKGLCGGVDPSPDERAFRNGQLNNGSKKSWDIINDICSGDNRFQKAWLQPAIDKAIASLPAPTTQIAPQDNPIIDTPQSSTQVISVPDSSPVSIFIKSLIAFFSTSK